MSMLIDIGAIKDEDMLRRMWQETDDFCRKKEIRAHMYKLRETRLRDFYSGDMDAGIGLSKTPLTASHGDSLADQSFQSFKTKEIRDSESPTREFKYGVPANLGGWNIMTSSELSNDGKMHTTHTLATTGGVHDLADGRAKFTGRNEKISSVAFDGDDKNYTTSSGENSNTVLEENIVQGDENNRRVENKKSTVTTSSKVIRSHYESGDNDCEPQYIPASETIERKIIYNEAPQSRVTTQQPNNNGPRNSSSPSNNKSEQLISRTVEYPDPHTKVIREVKSLPDGSTVTTTKYETRSANSEVWTSSNTNKNTSTSTSRITKENRDEHNRIQYIIDDRGNQVPYQPNRHIQNKTTRDVEGYEITVDTTNERNVPINKTVKKDLTREMERLTEPDDVIRSATTTTTTTTKTNRNNDVYDVKRPTKVDKKPNETEYTRKRISVDLDPTHEAFARSLRCVSPVSDRDSIRSHRSTTSSIRSSISPDKGFRSRRSNSRDTDISQISSQTVTKSGPTPGLKSPQRASPGKRPEVTTTTVKTEKIVRIPKDEKSERQTPSQRSQVTDLDSDDTTETKTTTVTTTTVENKDRPKGNRPPFVRSETYEERCRKILGMPEPDDQPKSPVTRRSKFTTTTTDFIENEKIDIVKNRTVSTERPKSIEKNPGRKPSDHTPFDEPTINTNTFDRKTPRSFDNSAPNSKPESRRPGDEITEKIQRRPNEKSKSPGRGPYDRRSPSKLIETTTTTVTSKTPRGPANEGPNSQSPDRKIPNRELPDRKPSKILETTKTMVTREISRRPENDRVSPDRKTSRRPTTDHDSPDRKTVVTKNVKNVEKYGMEVNEIIITRKQPRHPSDSAPDRKSPNRKTIITDSTVTRKAAQPINKLDGPESDEEIIDESEPEYEVIDRKPAQKLTDEPNHSPQDNESEDFSDTVEDTPGNQPHRPLYDGIDRCIPEEEIIETTTTYTSRRPTDEIRPSTDDGLDYDIPSRPSKVVKEITEASDIRKTPQPVEQKLTITNQRPHKEKSPDRITEKSIRDRSPGLPSDTTNEITETRITRESQLYINDLPRTRKNSSPDRPTNATISVTKSDKKNIESLTSRNTQRRPNDESPDRQSPGRTIPGQRSPDPQLPGRTVLDRRSSDRHFKTGTDVIETDENTTETTVIRKTQRRPNDESPDRTIERPTSDLRSPDRPSNVTKEITETTTKRKTSRQPDDVLGVRKTPDRRSPDRPTKLSTRVVEANKETFESLSHRRTQRYPNNESPDRQSPGRTVPGPRSPDRQFKTTTDLIETDEETIETTEIRKTQRRPNDVSPDRKTIIRTTSDRRSPDRLSKIIETTTTRKPTRLSDDMPSTRKTPDLRSPDRATKTIESSITRRTQRRPNAESPDRQSPGRTVPDRRSPDKFKTTTDLTQRSPNDVSPDRKTIIRTTPDRRSPDRPWKTSETITTRKTSRQLDDVPRTRKTPDRRSPDHPNKITTRVVEANTETVESFTRRTQRHPNNESPDRQSPGRTVPDRRSPDRQFKTTTDLIETDEETIETTEIRKTQRRPNVESSDRETIARTPDRRSPDRPVKIAETTATRKTTRQLDDVPSIRKIPDRRSPDRLKTTTNLTETDEDTIETTVIHKTRRRPNDESPDRETIAKPISDRQSPDRPSKITEKITETIINRKTSDRRSPDRPSKISTRVVEANKETIESFTRRTQRHPNDESPDRPSPGQRAPDHRSPDHQCKTTTDLTETDEDTVEITEIHKTQRRPNDESPDRETIARPTPDRQSPDRPSKITETIINRKTPDRRSPDRPSKISTRVVQDNKETIESFTRRTQRHPNDESPNRQSPGRRVPDHRTPDRQCKTTTDLTETDEDTVEITEIRKTQRRPNDESPDRETIARPTPDRQSPERPSKITEKITETTVNRKTPDRRTPDRQSSITNITETDEEIIESTINRNAKRYENKSPDRQSPGGTRPYKTGPIVNREFPTRTSPDRSSKDDQNIEETDEEVIETTVIEKTLRRPFEGSPDCTVPNRSSPGQKIPTESTRSTERLSKVTRNNTEKYGKVTETTHTRKTYRQPNDESSIDRSPSRTVPERRSTGPKPYKTRSYPENVSPERKTPNSRSPDRLSKMPTDQEIVETTVTRQTRRSKNISPDRHSPGRTSPSKINEIKIIRKSPRESEQSPDRPYKTIARITDTDEELVETTIIREKLRHPSDVSPVQRSPDRKTADRPTKVTKQLTETTVTSKTRRYPTTGSPDRKTLTDKRQTPMENISPVRSVKVTKCKNDEEISERIVTRKINRRPIDESPDRKTPGRSTYTTTKPDAITPDRTHHKPTGSSTNKTTTTVTKITTSRRPTPSYTDDTAPLRPKPIQKSPEEIVESDEPVDELRNRHRGAPEPGYLRPTQASRPKTQSPERKISTATYINETDEEIHETIIKRKPIYNQPDQNGNEPINRRSVNKTPDTRSPERKTEKTTTHRISRPRSPDQDDNNTVHRITTTTISKKPVKGRPVDRSPDKNPFENSGIDDETIRAKQYEKFIHNEIHDTEINRHPVSERPGPLRRKPDDVEVIFERVVDTTNLSEVDNVLVEEEREVGCKLTGEPIKPKRQPKELSPVRHQPYESSPSRRTTLKKPTKFDDENEEITTTVERTTIRRPSASETSPDRRTTRPTKLRSPEISPVRRNIIKTVKEIIISPTQPRRGAKQPRSPETSPTRRTTHITTITKTIPDRSVPITSSKTRPQTTPLQPGQRKPNLDRINSEIITDRDEKRSSTTTIKSRQKTAPEIASPIVQRYTTKTESTIARSTKKQPVEFTPGSNEIVEEMFVKKEVKKLCDGDASCPRPLTNGTSPTKQISSKQEVPIRPPSKITEKIDRFSSNTTTQTTKKASITERKNTAPIVPSSRVPANDKFNRSASENQIRTRQPTKVEVNEPTNKDRRQSLKTKPTRPTKCIATKTINITNTSLKVDNDEMDILIDIQQAKSSREPSPNKLVPVPVSPETDTGPSRYPDDVTEPEDDRKPRRKVTNIPIFEEETSNFVSCDITEVPADNVTHYDDLEEGNVDESDEDEDHDRIVNVTDNDECLLSVSDKVSRFINLADETVTSKVITKKVENDHEIIDRRRPVTKELENDDCLLSVSDKVSKFIMTAEQFKKPKASTDFITVEKINETDNRPRPVYEHPGTTEDEEFDDEERETIHVNKMDRINANKVTKIIEKKPSETVITTTTTTTTRKVKPVEPRTFDEEINVARPKETKVSTIASKFTKPNDELSRQSSIKRITTDTKVSSIRTKFDKNIEVDEATDEPIEEPGDRYEPVGKGREPFFLNQNGANNQQIETISKIVQSSFTDQVPDDHQTTNGSVTDRFKPNIESPKIKKITPTPILQSTEVMKKAKEIFENKPNDRPKQIDILSRPSVWKYKTNEVKLTDIGVHTTKTSTTEVDSEEEILAVSQPEMPKTPKLSARDEFTLKNLRDVTNISSKKDLFERKFSSDRITTTKITNREFSESPVGGSPATTPTDSQGRYPTSNKPSYMNHTVSSLEHINRRDSRSQIPSDHESIDDTNSINSTKFGVELRRVDSQNATKTRRKSSSSEIPCIEEIWDLELLERMLETVVGYEHRRRIRSQIRIIKKQIEEEEMHTSRITSSEITSKRISKERTRSPSNKRIETVTTTTTTVPKIQPVRKLSPQRTVTKTTRVIDEPDQKVSKVVTTTTTITKGGGDIIDDGKPIWTKKNLLKKPSENQIKTSSPSTTTSSTTTRKYNTSSYREVEKTDSVTSSYGIGPTDENGKPLFGIRALKKQAQKTEQPKEPVYSTDSDTYQTDDQTSKIAETINLQAPQKIREGYQSATKTVKKSTKNFIKHELIDDQPESDTEEIDEYEYESKDRSQTKFTKEVHSNIQSFLGSEKTYTGFNDVIDRMQNADHVQVEGDTESDREARALLNKFLGASILVQATESVLPDGVKVTQKTTRTLKSDLPASSATRQVTTTKLTKVKSSNSNNKDTSSNNTGAIATTITTTAVNDIDSIWDESYLRKLLEQSSNYEERRKIRARIRQIMADKEACTDLVEQTTKDLSASSINTILTTSSSQSSEIDNTNDNSNSDIPNITDGNNDDNNKKSVDDSKTEDIDGESLLLPLLKGLLSRKAQNTCTIKNNNNNSNNNSNDSKVNKNFIGPPVEDSGTESGEDLKLIAAGLRDSIDNNNNNSNTTGSNSNNSNVNNLLNDVTKALERLQNSLISDKDLKFDMNKKNTLLTLVSRLQSGLNQSGEASSALCDPNDEPDDDENDIDLTIYNKRIGTNQNRFLKRRNRNNRHTIGVSRDEIAEARRLIEDIQLREKSLSNSNSNSDSPDLTNKPSLVPSYSLQKNNSIGTFLPPVPNSVQPPQLFRPNQFVSQHSASVHAKKLQFMKQSRSFEQEKFNNATDDEDSSTSPMQTTDNKFIKNLQNNETKLSQVNGNVAQKTSADDLKLNKYSSTSAKKLKMKRANTIDIPKNRLFVQDEQTKDNNSPIGLRGLVKPSDVKQPPKNLPKFQPKTENDLKFLAFLNKQNSNENKIIPTVARPPSSVVNQQTTVQYRIPPQSAPIIPTQSQIPPGQPNWTNQFGNRKNVFEFTTNQPATPNKPPIGYSGQQSTAKNFWKKSESFKASPYVAPPSKPPAPAGPQYPWIGKEKARQNEQNQMVRSTPNLSQVNNFSHAPLSAFQPIAPRRAPQTIIKPNIDNVFKPITQNTQPPPTHQYKPVPMPRTMLNKQQTPSPVGEKFKPTHTLMFNSQPSSPARSPVIGAPWAGKATPERRVLSIAASKFEKTSDPPPMPVQSQVRRNSPSMKFKDNFNRLVEKRPSLPNNSFDYATQFASNTQTIQNTNINENSFPTYTYTCTDYTQPSCVSTYIPKLEHQNSLTSPDAEPLVLSCNRPIISPSYSDHSDATEYSSVTSKIMRAPVQQTAVKVGNKITTRNQNYDLMSGLSKETTAKQNLSTVLRQKVPSDSNPAKILNRNSIAVMNPPIVIETPSSPMAMARSEAAPPPFSVYNNVNRVNNMLAKSDSWHQINQMNQAYVPPKPVFAPETSGLLQRTKSGHTLQLPRPFEPTLQKSQVSEKQKTVEAYFSGKVSPKNLSRNSSQTNIHERASISPLPPTTTIGSSKITATTNVKSTSIKRTKTNEKTSTGGKTTTEIVKETEKDDDGGVTTTTTKVTRTVTASKPVSPFAKFRQLDKQASTQSPPNSPHTPNTPKTPGQTSAPIFKFTDPALNRRVATFKEQLLQWCQIKTREYENVKIENFSTSWSDGLAFCALIHHFRPDAFDYTKLVATQRRYNFDLAFRVADEKAGIAPLLDVEDMVVMRKPDWKCVFTYVQSIHRRFKDAD